MATAVLGSTLLRALCAAGPEEWGLIELPTPQPGIGEALIRVRRAGLCHTDVLRREGQSGPVSYPFIPGHEYAGVIEAVGSGVRFVKPGDRVAVNQVIYCGECQPCRRGDGQACYNRRELAAADIERGGAFAEYSLMHARQLLKLQDHVSLAEGALVEPLANAVSAVRQARIQIGEQVVVIGPGPIGLLAVQVARLFQPSILALVGTRDARLRPGKRFGATHTVNITREGALEELKSILGGKGADAVILCAGTTSAYELAMEVIGWRGRITLEGSFLDEETVSISPRRMQLLAASLIAISGWTIAEFVQARELLASGRIDGKSVITHTFPLEQWEEAYSMITDRKSEAIKVMFEI